MIDKGQPNIQKFTVFMLALAVLISLTVISTVYALNGIRYAGDVTPEPVEDVFQKPAVSCQVSEGEDGAYTITNNGNVPVYLRVAINPLWMKDNGAVHYTNPVVDLELGSDWGVGIDDGFYYYPYELPAMGTVTVRVIHDDVTDPCPVDYELKMNLAVEVIQSDPSLAAVDAWGFVGSGSIVEGESDSQYGQPIEVK